MSPKISISVRLANIVPSSDRPLDILRAAFRAAVSMGMRIRAQEDPGVALAELGVSWRTTHHRREVNLAGAVCMARQPPSASRDEAADIVAARVLDVSWMWMLGALDGYSREVHPEWLTELDADSYRDGLWAGHQLWVEMTVECPACGDRRLPIDDDCTCTRPKRR